MPPDFLDTFRAFVSSLLARDTPQAQTPAAPPQTFQDTLQSLVGGDVTVREDSGFLKARNALANAFGGTPIAGQAHNLPLISDRVHLEANAARPTVAHEFGHVADFREAFDPAVIGRIEELTPEDVEDPNEFFADLFARGVDFLQTTARPDIGAKMAEVFRPGLEEEFGEEAVNLMLDQLVRTNVFAAHPMRQQFAIEPSGLEMFISTE